MKRDAMSTCFVLPVLRQEISGETMTATEELNKWIAEFGNERDALNVALARLAAAEANLSAMTNKAGDEFERAEAAEAHIRADINDRKAVEQALTNEWDAARNDVYETGNQGWAMVVGAAVDRLMQQIEAAEARAARLAEFLHYFCDIWHETKRFRNQLPETWDFDGINEMENNARATLMTAARLKGELK